MPKPHNHSLPTPPHSQHTSSHPRPPSNPVKSHTDSTRSQPPTHAPTHPHPPQPHHMPRPTPASKKALARLRAHRTTPYPAPVPHSHPDQATASVANKDVLKAIKPANANSGMGEAVVFKPRPVKFCLRKKKLEWRAGRPSLEMAEKKGKKVNAGTAAANEPAGTGAKEEVKEETMPDVTVKHDGLALTPLPTAATATPQPPSTPTRMTYVSIGSLKTISSSVRPKSARKTAADYI
ncbi:hypothetical protein EDC01DRAFT_627904 [Geopyxis carbonaria]|nr:hypothetical protein EDC01DRAFT_627904 [Geopyxis carbonaria]